MICSEQLRFKFFHFSSVPDIPSVATKTVRDSKESVPVASSPTTNDNKLSHSQVQVTADSKPLQREHSNESSEKEAETERRAPVVSIEVICKLNSTFFSRN